MSEAKTKVFIVGDRAYGVIIVSFVPYHVIRVTRDAIKRYADKYHHEVPNAYDEVFDLVGRSVLTLVTHLSDDRPLNDIDTLEVVYHDLLTSRGVKPSNADFCVIGLIDPERHDDHEGHPGGPGGSTSERRKSHSMLHQAVEILLTNVGGGPQDIELEPDDITHGGGGGGGHGHGGGGGHDH